MTEERELTTLAVSREVADRVRTAAKESGLSVQEYATLALRHFVEHNRAVIHVEGTMCKQQ